jgi:hypothetical protein
MALRIKTLRKNDTNCNDSQHNNTLKSAVSIMPVSKMINQNGILKNSTQMVLCRMAASRMTLSKTIGITE